MLGVDIEINEISRYLARKSLLRGESVYISTSDGKVIAHSNASVILPDSAAGDDAFRFRAISELLGIGGTAGKRLSELTERTTRKKFIRRGSILHPGVKIETVAVSAGGRDRTRVSPCDLCATVNRRYHSSNAADASNVMISLPSVLRPPRFPCVLPLAVLAVTTVFATGALAQGRYRSPDEAVAALADSLRTGAPQRVMRVLGQGSEEIVLSGDPVDDAALRRRFLAAFDAKYQIVRDGEDQAVLIVGDERWPFPIRLMRLNNTWRFNTQLASSEMVYRRIGRNEMSAIDACGVYVAAQKEYAEKGYAGKGVYARRFISQPGERDGLYWPAPSSEDESPLGEFATSAAEQGYSVEGKRWAPYQGYYYKILTRQGPNAAGGEVDYMVSGDMVGGFALVAYPAQYRRSGLMTFLVNHQGTIYEKDLGLRTTDIGMEMTSFDPDSTWRRMKRAVQIPIRIDIVSPPQGPPARD